MIKIGISSCLLGENVRYDGGHKLDRYLRDIFGRFVEWVPVCPEVECGLPVPREAMRLVGKTNAPRLMTRGTGIDHTPRMQKWSQKKLSLLANEQLCGFIFKSRSPSSGMQGVKVYLETGQPSNKGIGLFARAFMDIFPEIPVEDDGRLHDADIRENFIERVFVFHRWKKLNIKNKTIKNLVDFHTDHKLLLMSHSPEHLTELGKHVAQAKDQPPHTVFESYFSTLMDALRLKATVKKNVNVLHHMMGFLKKRPSSDENQELLDIIEHYHQGLTPLIVPVTMLNHYVRKYDVSYLKRQVYLNPHPMELMLRNHV